MGVQAKVMFHVQVREYMDRITKADANARKAQSDASKAHKLARQLETDVQALRWALLTAELLCFGPLLHRVDVQPS